MIQSPPQKPVAAVARTLRGIATALRARARVVWGVTAALFLFGPVAPVVVLSVARRPPDFITFNPWLPRLPEYLTSSEPLMEKLSFISGMVIGWVSADNEGEGIDWGFIIDVPTLARVLLTSLAFGAYFALWSYRRAVRGLSAKAARPAGIAGVVTGILGLSTAPCAMIGDIPVLPVFSLAFTGLSSGALDFLSMLSRISFAVVFIAMTLAILWLGWREGGAPRPAKAAVS